MFSISVQCVCTPVTYYVLFMYAENFGFKLFCCFLFSFKQFSRTCLCKNKTFSANLKLFFKNIFVFYFFYFVLLFFFFLYIAHKVLTGFCVCCSWFESTFYIKVVSTLYTLKKLIISAYFHIHI